MQFFLHKCFLLARESTAPYSQSHVSRSSASLHLGSLFWLYLLLSLDRVILTKIYKCGLARSLVPACSVSNQESAIGCDRKLSVPKRQGDDFHSHCEPRREEGRTGKIKGLKKRKKSSPPLSPSPPSPPLPLLFSRRFGCSVDYFLLAETQHPFHLLN